MGGIMADNQLDVLRILLICADEERYRRFAKREKTAFDTAKEMVEERQKNWFDRISKIYHRTDIFDPKNYNLVIDTTNLSVDQILKTVLDKLGD